MKFKKSLLVSAAAVALVGSSSVFAAAPTNLCADLDGQTVTLKGKIDYSDYLHIITGKCDLTVTTDLTSPGKMTITSSNCSHSPLDGVKLLITGVSCTDNTLTAKGTYKYSTHTGPFDLTLYLYESGTTLQAAGPGTTTFTLLDITSHYTLDVGVHTN